MADEVEEDIDNVPSMLLPCVSCNRTFRPEALAKHSKVCEKTLKKKRKVFDSSKQRIQGTELAEFLPVLPTFTKKSERSPVRKVQAQSSSSTLSSSSKTSLSSPKSKWREKHSELVQTIQAARLPPEQAPAAPARLSSQEQCPYCERSFGPKAYDRHLEWCREQQTRIQPKSPASQRARQRLEARTKYQAPLTNKCRQKRSGSRDKLRDPSPSPQYTGSPHTPTMTRRKTVPTAAVDVVSSPCLNTFVKGTALRSSTRSSVCVTGSNKKPQLTRSNRAPDIPSPPPSVLTLDLDDDGGDGWRADDDTADTDSLSISTFEVEFLDEYLDASTPKSVGQPSPSSSPTGGSFSSPSPVGLNRTYSKDDLKDLLECTSVKSKDSKKKDKLSYGLNKSNTGRKNCHRKKSDVSVDALDLSSVTDVVEHNKNKITQEQTNPKYLNGINDTVEECDKPIVNVSVTKDEFSSSLFSLADVQCDLIDFDPEITIPDWKAESPNTDGFLEDWKKVAITNDNQSMTLDVTRPGQYGLSLSANSGKESKIKCLNLCYKLNVNYINFGVFINLKSSDGELVLNLPMFNTFVSDALLNQYLNYFNLNNLTKHYLQSMNSKNKIGLQPSNNNSCCFKFKGISNGSGESIISSKSFVKIKSTNEEKVSLVDVFHHKNKAALWSPSPAKRRKRNSGPLRDLMQNATCATNGSDSDCYWDYYETDMIVNQKSSKPKVVSKAPGGVKKPNSTVGSNTVHMATSKVELSLLNAPLVKSDDYQTVFVDDEDRPRTGQSEMSSDSLNSAAAVTYKRTADCDILTLSDKEDRTDSKLDRASFNNPFTNTTQHPSSRTQGNKDKSVYTIELINSRRSWKSSCENLNNDQDDRTNSEENFILQTHSVELSNFKLPSIAKITNLSRSFSKHCVNSVKHNQSRENVNNALLHMKKSVSEGNVPTKFVSQLPVLINKKLKPEKPPLATNKNTHWTGRVNQRREEEESLSPVKVVKDRNPERMARSSRQWVESDDNSETGFFNLRRHRLLSPIASASLRKVESSTESSGEHEDSSFYSTGSRFHNQKFSRIRLLPPLAVHSIPPLRHHCKTYVDGRKQFKHSRKFSEPEPYDPFKSAERQMLELLGPDKEPPKLAPLTPITKPSTVLSSPTSAFTKFSSVHTPEPLFISEDDNSRSRRSSDKSDSPLLVMSPCDNYTSSKDTNQNPISLSTLSLCSTISIESVDGNRNNRYPNSAKAPEKKTPVMVRRTSSAIESRRPRDPLKGMLKMEDMLYGSNREGERYFGSPLITGLDKDSDDHSSNGSLYKAVSDAETLNAEQELLKSMSEFEKLLFSSSSSPSPSSLSLKLFPSLGSSCGVEERERETMKPDLDLHSAVLTTGPDSAYSSLNRKSPVGGEQERGDGGEAARFCHECGAKYPLLAAKFCCQCGVRRLVI